MVQLESEGVARRIIAAIKQRIHGGEYQPGDRLPSSRALAAEWGVSRTTVTAAYGQLIAEGYLLNRPGARAVVARGLAAAVAPKAAAPGGTRALSDFARRLLSFPAPARFQTYRIADLRYGDLNGADFPILAWRRALNRASLRRAERLRYGDPQGSAPLRTALQSYLWRARGISCAPEQIIVVNGSQQGLDLCARLLLNPGDRFVMEDPGYVLARHVFAASGGVAVLPDDSVCRALAPRPALPPADRGDLHDRADHVEASHARERARAQSHGEAVHAELGGQGRVRIEPRPVPRLHGPEAALDAVPAHRAVDAARQDHLRDRRVRDRADGVSAGGREDGRGEQEA